MSDIQIEGKATIWRQTFTLRILNGVLQQLFIGTEFTSVGLSVIVEEWRDVPQVTE
jgi:hypothetical protein